MKVPKPTDADKSRFETLMPVEANVVVKPMFGNVGAFVNGNMFAALFGSSIGLRLSDVDREALMAVPGSDLFGPEDRPMRAYVEIPPGWSDEEASDWIDKALAHVAELPPKQQKPKKSR